MTDLEAARNEIHDAKPDGGFVGTPVDIERRGWEQYTFDTRERAKAGRRSREWTAVAHSELEVVREMARCLREIREGRVAGVADDDSPQRRCHGHQGEKSGPCDMFVALIARGPKLGLTGPQQTGLALAG